jgi:hypothetical protein
MSLPMTPTTWWHRILGRLFYLGAVCLSAIMSVGWTIHDWLEGDDA